ncbi:MAG: AI-2E family transporter [Vicinamibacterales bacterium]
MSDTGSEPAPRQTDPSFVHRVLVAVGLTLLCLLIVALLWQAAEILLLVFAGLLLAILLRSVADFVSTYTTLPSTWSMLVVMLSIAAVVALGWRLVAPSVQQEFSDLSDQLPVIYDQVRTKVSEYPLGRRIVDAVPSARNIAFGRQSGNIFERITGVVSTAFELALNTLIVLMVGAYFSFSLPAYKNGLIALVPVRHEPRARQLLAVIHFTLQRFLLGIAGSMTVNGLLTFGGLWFLGISFAVPLGIIAGIMSFIPNLGPLIAGFPAFLIAVAVSPSQGLYVVLLYLFVQNLDGYVITPLIQQRAASIPPVLLVASQLLLAVVFGFLGLLLAVPLVAVVFVAVRMLYVEDVLGRQLDVPGEQRARRRVSGAPRVRRD